MQPKGFGFEFEFNKFHNLVRYCTMANWNGTCGWSNSLPTSTTSEAPVAAASGVFSVSSILQPASTFAQHYTALPPPPPHPLPQSSGLFSPCQNSQLNSSTPASAPTSKKPRKMWEDVEVRTLISHYKENMSHLQSADSPAAWRELTRSVNDSTELEKVWTVEQVKKKLHNLKDT